MGLLRSRETLNLKMIVKFAFVSNSFKIVSQIAYHTFTRNFLFKMKFRFIWCTARITRSRDMLKFQYDRRVLDKTTSTSPIDAVGRALRLSKRGSRVQILAASVG